MFQPFCVVCLIPKINFKNALCSFCQRKVDERRRCFSFREEDGVLHYYIFSWDKSSALFCKELIYYLKHKKEEFFSEWASYFDEVSFKKNMILVPSSSSEGLNHASSFASALLKLKGFSGVKEVDVGRTLDQKRKGRSERLKSNKIELGELKINKNWIFVDDILVSGGTYKKVLKAAGRKPQAIVTLFYKPYLNNKGFYDG